jgi:hypothetical protein
LQEKYFSSRARRAVARTVKAWLSVAGVSAILACSGSGRSPAFDGELGPAPKVDGPRNIDRATPCESGDTADCAVELGTHDGLVDCARGVKVCSEGQWGPCIPDAAKGTRTVRAPATLSGTGQALGPQSVGGNSQTCTNNVCDPYCWQFDDVPDAGIKADGSFVSTGAQWGGSLQASNVPPAFKTKGSLDTQCSDPPASDSYAEACQFDQHCVNGACTAFAPLESGSCTGIDITAPTTCIPQGGGFRTMTVCNRGTVAAPPGIKCYVYPGGSPQYPNSDPGLGTTLVMTTATTIEPGHCESQNVPEALWGQNGIESVACNPLDQQNVSVSIGPRFPTTNAQVSGQVAFTSPELGYADDAQYATAAPANPNGATTVEWPTTFAAVGADGAWSSRSNARSDQPAGQYATASPSMPASGTGVIGPVFPSSTETGSTFSNPGNVYAADGAYATASPSNPATPVTLGPSFPSSNNGSLSWSNLGNLAAADGAYATSTLSGNATNAAYLDNFGFNSVPAGAVFDSIAIEVKWKSTVNNTKYDMGVQAYVGAGATAVGSELTKSSPLTTETTQTLTIPAASLTALASTDLVDGKFRVKLRFSRGPGNVAASTASVDYVKVTVVYHTVSNTATLVVGGFGLGSLIPAGATLAMTTEVKWKTSAVNSNVVLGVQAYKNWGQATQAAIGSEATRSPAAANTDYVDVTPSSSPQPGDLANSTFRVRIRVTRSATTTPNVDVTAYVDYVKVTVTWTTGSTPTTHSVMFGGFGFDNLIPSNATITSVQSEARWKLSTTTAHATLGLQAYANATSTALGTETTDTTAPLTDTTRTQTVTTGVTRADLDDANFGVMVRVSRDSSTATVNPDFTAYLDYVRVTVSWTAPGTTHGVAYGGFGFNAIPADATVVGIKTEVKWKVSVSTSHATLGIQAFTGGGATAVGSEYTDTSPPTTATIAQQTLSNLTLGPNDLDDSNFKVRVRVARSSGTSGGGNPDFTASIDWVRVTVTYSDPQTTSVGECNISNNWTATKLVPDPDACQDMSISTFTPFTVTRTFVGACPQGAMPQWQKFGYTSVTPAGTQIEFRFRAFEAAADGTCPTLPAATTSPPAPVATASPTGDPAICSIASASGTCPKDLFTALGGLPAATYPCLQMDAYGVPSTTESPELLDWVVTYDCIENL